MTSLRLLYVTTKDTDEARKIARELVQRRLVACANILPKMEAVYRWKGQIEESSEVVLILKTEKQLVAKTIEAVQELHSYEAPCVLSLPIEQGAEGYLNWLSGEVS